MFDFKIRLGYCVCGESISTDNIGASIQVIQMYLLDHLWQGQGEDVVVSFEVNAVILKPATTELTL